MEVVTSNSKSVIPSCSKFFKGLPLIKNTIANDKNCKISIEQKSPKTIYISNELAKFKITIGKDNKQYFFKQEENVFHRCTQLVIEQELASHSAKTENPTTNQVYFDDKEYNNLKTPEHSTEEPCIATNIIKNTDLKEYSGQIAFLFKEFLGITVFRATNNLQSPDIMQRFLKITTSGLDRIKENLAQQKQQSLVNKILTGFKNLFHIAQTTTHEQKNSDEYSTNNFEKINPKWQKIAQPKFEKSKIHNSEHWDSHQNIYAETHLVHELGKILTDTDGFISAEKLKMLQQSLLATDLNFKAAYSYDKSKHNFYSPDMFHRFIKNSLLITQGLSENIDKVNEHLRNIDKNGAICTNEDLKNIIFSNSETPTSEDELVIKARQEAISAVLAPLDQVATGTCYANSISNTMRLYNPVECVKNMSEILQFNKLTIANEKSISCQSLLTDNLSESQFFHPLTKIFHYTLAKLGQLGGTYASSKFNNTYSWQDLDNLSCANLDHGGKTGTILEEIGGGDTQSDKFIFHTKYQKIKIEANTARAFKIKKSNEKRIAEIFCSIADNTKQYDLSKNIINRLNISTVDHAFNLSIGPKMTDAIKNGQFDSEKSAIQWLRSQNEPIEIADLNYAPPSDKLYLYKDDKGDLKLYTAAMKDISCSWACFINSGFNMYFANEDTMLRLGFMSPRKL